MVAFYQHDIAAWMDGTEGLTDGQYRAYHVVCELIYLNNGPVVLHESGIAGRCGQHVLAFRKNFRELVEIKKLVVLESGKVTNLRVESELKRIMARRRRATTDPSPTPGPPQANYGGVERGFEGGGARKPLNGKGPTLFADAPEEKRIEPRGAKAPLADPEKELFDRGKQVLGKTAGGLIKNLLDAKGGSIARARAAIEEASEKQDPREFVGAMVKTGGGRRGGSGFAAVARRLGEQERNDGGNQ